MNGSHCCVGIQDNRIQEAWAGPVPEQAFVLKPRWCPMLEGCSAQDLLPLASRGSAALLVECPPGEEWQSQGPSIPDKSVLTTPAGHPAYPAWNRSSKNFPLLGSCLGTAGSEGGERVLLVYGLPPEPARGRTSALLLPAASAWAQRVTVQLQPAWGAGCRVMERQPGRHAAGPLAPQPARQLAGIVIHTRARARLPTLN